jgi:dolichol-phosphate mannosyltransferase
LSFWQADLAIGSRYAGVNVVNWPLNRSVDVYFVSVYVRLITGMKIHDATAGLSVTDGTFWEKLLRK